MQSYQSPRFRPTPYVEPTLPQGAPETLPVCVVHRAVAARDVVTLWLAQPGTFVAPAPYQPGQFITLALPTSERRYDTLYRSYSLCGDGSRDRPWEITVKRQHAGAVSSYLYEHAQIGMLLSASPPRGTFMLPERIPPGAPMVFVAAGTGIAPIYGMLRWLAQLPAHERPRVQLHYASSSVDDVIYSQELAALDPTGRWMSQWHYITDQGVRMTPEVLLTRAGSLATAAQWYICGSEALKRTLQRELFAAGVPAERVHVEVFTSPVERKAAYSRPAWSGTYPRGAATLLRLADSGALLDVQDGETLLLALERQGYRPEASCRSGACGVCRVRLLAGQVRDGAGSGGLMPDEAAAGYVLTCVARPEGDVTLATGGRTIAGTADGQRTARPATAARRTATLALRATTVAAAAALFVGAWNLTDYSPYSAAVQPTPNIDIFSGVHKQPAARATPTVDPNSEIPPTPSGVIVKPAATPTPQATSGVS